MLYPIPIRRINNTPISRNAQYNNINNRIDRFFNYIIKKEKQTFEKMTQDEEMIIKIYKMIPEKRKIYSSLVKIMGSDASE